MRLRRKQATIANLRYFALAALGLVAAGFIAHPAAAAFILIADACIMIGVAGLAGFNFDNNPQGAVDVTWCLDAYAGRLLNIFDQFAAGAEHV